MPRARGTLGICGICELQDRVYHFNERIIARINGFDIVEGLTICPGCIGMLIDTLTEDSTTES